MAKEKRCPISTPVTYCFKEECAWWDSLVGLCAILSIARFGVKTPKEQKETLIEKINREEGG